MATRSRKQSGEARVLVVARPALAELVRVTLAHGPYVVETMSDVADAEVRKLSWRAQLVIVDIDLPGDPLQLVGEIIAARRVASIVLTTAGDLRTRIAAFDQGADDVLTVPITPEDLVARVYAVMRRTYGESLPLVPSIKVAGLDIDLLERTVRSNGKPVHLTETEQALLYLFASNAGTTLERGTILDALWGADYTAESNLVDRHVRNLRVKLKDDWRSPRFIRTVPGRGYRFIAGPA